MENPHGLRSMTKLINAESIKYKRKQTQELESIAGKQSPSKAITASKSQKPSLITSNYVQTNQVKNADSGSDVMLMVPKHIREKDKDKIEEIVIKLREFNLIEQKRREEEIMRNQQFKKVKENKRLNVYGMEKSEPKHKESVMSKVYKQLEELGLHGFANRNKDENKEEAHEEFDLDQHHFENEKKIKELKKKLSNISKAESTIGSVSRFTDAQCLLLNPKKDASRKQLIFSNIYKPEAERMKEMMKEGTIEIATYPEKLGELNFKQSDVIKKILSKKFKQRSKIKEYKNEISKEESNIEMQRKLSHKEFTKINPRLQI